MEAPSKEPPSVKDHGSWSVLFESVELPWRSALQDGVVIEVATPAGGMLSREVDLVFFAEREPYPLLLGRAKGMLTFLSDNVAEPVRLQLSHLQLLDEPATGRRHWMEDKDGGLESERGLEAGVGEVRCTLRPMIGRNADEAGAIIAERRGRLLEAEEGDPSSGAGAVALATWLEYPMSSAVNEIVTLADLASRHSAADTLTSEHLLVALLNVGDNDLLRSSGSNGGAAAILVRMLNERNAEFLGRYRFEVSPEKSVPNPQRLVAPDADALIKHARQLSRDTGNEDGRIAGRHLVTAVLSASLPSAKSAGTRAIFSDHGIDPTELRTAFLSSLIAQGPSDEREAWERLFEMQPREDPRSWLPSFNADLASGEDKLDMRPDIEAMASLIVSKSLQPPLSIGLFGNWGSGKSFFMQKLRQAIRDLSHSTEADNQRVYWPNVVTVEFNAWHYVDANLWASLVAHLFGELRRWGAPEDGIAEEVLQQKNAALNKLKVASEARDAAQQRLDEAQRALEQAHKRHDDAVGSVRMNNHVLSMQLARDLWAELKDVSTLSKPLRQAAESLHGSHLATGVSVASVERLYSQLKELGETGGRLRATGWTMLHGRARWVALAWLLGGTAVALLLGVETAWGTNFGPMASLVAQAAAIVIAGAQWVTRSAQHVSRLVTPLEEVRRKIESAYQTLRDERDQLVSKFRKEVEASMVEVTISTQALTTAEQAVGAAQALVKEATTARMISRFIEGRASSDDYRKHLGIVSTIREDFDRLSKLITTHNELLLKPSRSAVTDDVRDLGINRIVLFIDDLDRCPPSRVVEVLQAIHLLLAFELFVVVVGVDSRWVEHSLAVQYPELLKRSRQPGRNGSMEPHDKVGEPEEMPARPSDYLEKIFQIPYRVRRMDDTGCRNLIEALVVGDRDSATASVKGERDAAKANVLTGGEGERARTGMDQSVPSQSEHQRSAERGMDNVGNVAAQTERMAAATKQSPAPPPKISIEALRLTENEVREMKGLAPLIGRSPRATKRFVNIYRLIKAAVPLAGQQAFLSGGFRLPMWLLAVSTQAPSLAKQLVMESIQRSYTGLDLWQALTKLSPRLLADDSIALLGKLSEQEKAWAAVSANEVGEWQERVAQFSFEEMTHATVDDLDPESAGASHDEEAEAINGAAAERT